jgi:hypothetical protein
MKKQKFGLILLLLLLISYITVKASDVDEYFVKATMTARFPKHIEWPKDPMENNRNLFVIAVIGKNPFGSNLEFICKKATKNNNQVQVRYISKVEEIAESGCNLLFISKTSKKKLGEIVAFTETKPILTISDTKGYAEMGVHINFLIKNNKLNFEINRIAIRKSGLNVNYHLFTLAARVIN